MSGRENHQLLVNGRIFTGDEIISNHEVLLANGIIETVRKSSSPTDDLTVIDLEGGLLAPGFIDCQVNGGGGVMFNDQPTPDSIAKIIEAHRTFGTTGLLPTLISDAWDVMQSAVEAVRSTLKSGLPGLLGLHFEGPYLNLQNRGAHAKNKIRPITLWNH